MSAEPIDLEAERLVRDVAAALLAIAPGECLCCFVGRMLDQFGCDCTLRFAKRYRDAKAPLATAMERRLGDVGGFCDCEIFLNGWMLHQRFWTAAPEADVDGLGADGDLSEPVELPPCGKVRRGSVRPCGNWVRQRRGRGGW